MHCKLQIKIENSKKLNNYFNNSNFQDKLQYPFINNAGNSTRIYRTFII